VQCDALNDHEINPTAGLSAEDAMNKQEKMSAKKMGEIRKKVSDP
jgi:hypothetical protein